MAGGVGTLFVSAGNDWAPRDSDRNATSMPGFPLAGGLSGLAGVPPGIRPARCPRGGVSPAVERQLHLLTSHPASGLDDLDFQLEPPQHDHFPGPVT
jgi:hypothetical protein